jgi:hypothetical protein
MAFICQNEAFDHLFLIATSEMGQRAIANCPKKLYRWK